MKDDSTPSGIPAVGPVSWGSHICQLYETPHDMADVLVPYFKTGLERNELCHWVTSEAFRAEDAKSALRAAYPALDTALARGQITIMDRQEWYQRDGEFDAVRVVNGWLAHEESARSLGYSGYRLTGDTLWLEPHQWDAFHHYERLVNKAFGTRRIVALCTYCMGRCGASEILDLVNTHTFAVARRRGAWEMVESPSTKLAKAELAELNATLAARVEQATEELRALLDHKDALLREVHHRVKNNLQIVANLLAIRSRNASDEVRRVLSETADRVHAISAVHEALYEKLDDHAVMLTDRLRAIARGLAVSYGLDNRVSLNVSGDDVLLSISAGVPLALLVTELASNALKHAYPGDRRGQVEISVKLLPERRFEVTIADDGVGWVPNKAKHGSGLSIARAIAKQLDGHLELAARPGGGFQARFTAALQ